MGSPLAGNHEGGLVTPQQAVGGSSCGQMAQGVLGPVTQDAGSCGHLPEPHLPPEDDWVRGPRASPGSGRLFTDGHCDLRAFLSLSLQLQQMKEKKGLYPDKSVYTQQIGPGLCFGALALMLRFFFEVSRPGAGGGGCSGGPLHRATPSRAAGGDPLHPPTAAIAA